MTDLDKIVEAVRAQRCSWASLFRRHRGGHQCALFPERLLSEDEYQTLARRLTAPARMTEKVTPEEIRRNKLRALADAADSGGRRYGK